MFFCPSACLQFSLILHYPNHFQGHTTFFFKFCYIYLFVCESLEQARARVDLWRLNKPAKEKAAGGQQEVSVGKVLATKYINLLRLH